MGFPDAQPGGTSTSNSKKRRLAALNSARAPAHVTRSNRVDRRAVPVAQKTTREHEIYLRLQDETTAAACSALHIPNYSQDVNASLADLVSELAASASIASQVAMTRFQNKTIQLENPPLKGKVQTKPANFTSKLLSKRKLKQKGLLVMDCNLTWEKLAILRQKWKEYIARLTEYTPTHVELANKIARADFHGAYMKVIASSEARWVGIEGIVYEETKHTFLVMTQDGQCSILPKARCTFEVQIDNRRNAQLRGQGLIDRL